MIFISVILALIILGSLFLIVVNYKMENQQAVVGWAAASISTLFWLLHVVEVF